MSKELPYFKFSDSEWLLGNISLESFELQGIYISICALYWQRGGQLDKEMVNKRFRQPQALVDLIKGGYIHEENNNNLKIKFLDEQLNELGLNHKIRVEAGRKGGQASAKQRSSNAQANVKQTSTVAQALRKEEDKIREEKIASEFEQAYYIYPGNKRNLQTEWSDFAQYSNDATSDTPKFLKAVESYVAECADKEKKYIKQMGNYIRERMWEIKPKEEKSWRPKHIL